MGPFERFSAEEVEFSGKRAIRLTYQYELDAFSIPPRPPRLITLSVQKELTGYTRFPAAYEYLEGAGSQFFPTKEANPRPFPIIHIVAAPGVSILVQNWEDPDPKRHLQPSLEYPAFEIYRVQDPELVPILGVPILSPNLIGREPINSDVLLPSQIPHILLPLKPKKVRPNIPTTSGPKEPELEATVLRNIPTIYPENYFELFQEPSEIIIYHPSSATVLTISVPPFSSIPGDIRDAQARFCYEFDPQGKPLLKIVKTKTTGPKKPDEPDVVDIRVSWGPYPWLFLRATWGLEIYEVDDVNAVPPQGSPIVPQNGWTKVDAIRMQKLSPKEYQLLIQTVATAVAVFIIPGLGEIMAIGEFVYGIVTRRDPSGKRELTEEELYILGLGALLSVLSLAAGPSIYLGRHLIQKFGSKAGTAERMLIAIKKNAKLTKEEADLVRKLEGLVLAERSVELGDLQRLEAILRRLNLEYPSLKSILTRDGKGFTHYKLQEFYQQYCKTKKPADPDPEKWAIQQRRGRPLVLLEEKLGPDFRKARPVSAGPLINVQGDPRPLGYSEALVRTDIKTVSSRALMSQKAELMEMLDTFFEKPLPIDPVMRLHALMQIKSDNFGRLKGLLAEILSFRIQLKEILPRVAYNEPKAALISGVRMRLMSTEKQISQRKLSPEKRFSDNIVAVPRGGSMKMGAVIEVKSGYGGGREATSQIFDWNEDKITPGSQVVLPKGACYIYVNGAVKTIEKELVFTYKGRRGLPEVINLTAAERFIITASGESHLGMNSAQKIARPVPPKNRFELKRSSNELDYLTARIIAERLMGKL